MKYTSKKGTVINIPDGIDPKQIAKIKADADVGYGTRAQATANKLGKGLVKTPETGGGVKVDPGTDGLGDTAAGLDSYLDGIFGGLTPLDLSKAPKVLGAEDLAADRTRVYDASYAEGTKNLSRDQAMAMEEQKQELANRGIVYDPARQDSLYAKTTGAVNERFDSQRTSAANNARVAADASAQTAQGLSTTAHDSYVNDAVAGYTSQLNSATTAAGVLETLMKKYGLDQATAQEVLNRKSAEKIARETNAARNRPSGTSGGQQQSRPQAPAGGGFEIV
jgi:hypothetical protein